MQLLVQRAVNGNAANEIIVGVDQSDPVITALELVDGARDGAVFEGFLRHLQNVVGSLLILEDCKIEPLVTEHKASIEVNKALS